MFLARMLRIVKYSSVQEKKEVYNDYKISKAYR